MRLFRIILTTYCLFVFVSSSCAKSKSRCKNKKNSSWRLRLLRKISGQLNPGLKLLSLKGKKQRIFLPESTKGRILDDDSLGKHVPRIGCDESEDSVELVACPTPNSKGVLYCIEEDKLCDRIINCPNGEDEDLISCMFHRWTKSFFKIISSSLTDIKHKLSHLERTMNTQQLQVTKR